MIVVKVEQGSPEWIAARLGVVTVSHFEDIITPKTLKRSSGADSYLARLVGEHLLGYPVEYGGGDVGAYIGRGRDLESEARRFYEMTHDIECELVGFILRDDRRVGGSPDALVGVDGGVDFKCPALHTHVGYMLEPSKLAAAYRVQMQGYMYITGRSYWDLLSYSPVLPSVEMRVARDDVFLAALENVLNAFVAELDEAKRILAPYRRTATTAFEPDGGGVLLDMLQRSLAAT